MRRNNKRTFKIAMGGIFLALTIILLFGASFVPGVEMTLFALASLTTAFMIIESGVGGGALLFAAACILGAMILPNKLAVIPYAFFFGYYGIFKFYAEKIHVLWGQLALKLALFALVTCVGLLGFKAVLLGSIHLPDYPVAVLIIALIAMLFLYDFVCTLCINFYMRRFKRQGADNIKLSK